MIDGVNFDEELTRRLPLPLSQAYRRAQNAKTSLERHHAAFYVWESSLKLLGSIAVVEYACHPQRDPELVEVLANLPRPSLGHWWEIVRRLVVVLADRGDVAFQKVRDLLLGKMRDDLPRAAGLDAFLREAVEGHSGARSTVRLTELFDRLVRYRNQEIGHGAAGQRPSEYYDRASQALLAGIAEILQRLDVTAGCDLIYIGDVRRQPTGDWLVERFALAGEAARRIESAHVLHSDSHLLPRPEQIYLHKPGVTVGLPPSLHPLVIYDADTCETFFLNRQRGEQRIQYLCYTTGRTLDRHDLGAEFRSLLARASGVAPNSNEVTEWIARSNVEEPAPTATAEPPNRRIGEFELISELGRGGMGVVYRAWQPSLGRQVALKCLLHAGDAKAEARFMREIRALGRVEHPHLVKVFTSGAEGEQWFFAMELLEGAPLSAVIDQLRGRGSSVSDVDLAAWHNALQSASDDVRKAEKSLSKVHSDSSGTRRAATPPVSDDRPAQGVTNTYVWHVVDLIRQVADAAHALHEAHVIHRDIKPGNIIVSSDGSQAVLMDLGLAQLADDVEGRLTRTRQFVGTLRYASPEQVLAVGSLDRRTDIYSLGAVLWESLTLRSMFSSGEHTATPDLMRRIQYEEPDPIRKYEPRVAADLQAIVNKCLEKDPNRRYPTALELVHDLDRFLRGEPVQARNIGNVERLWRSMKRHPLETSFVAVCLVTLIALGFIAVDQQIKARERKYIVQLEAAAIEIQREQAKSEASFRQAVETLDRIFRLTSEGELRNHPDLQPLRANLLEYYQQYVAQRGSDPKLRADMADVYLRMASLTRVIDKKADAIKYFEKSLDIYRELTKEKDAPADRRTAQAAIHIELGTLFQDTRDFPRAESELKTALSEFEELTLAFPENLDYLSRIAEAHHNLGILYFEMNRMDESLQAYDQGRVIREQLVAKSPRRDFQRDLARSHGYLGDVQLAIGQPDQALTSYVTSERIRQGLVDTDPTDVEAQFQLARSFTNTGNLYWFTDRLPLAVEAFERARLLQERIVREHPAVTVYQSDLALTCNRLGELLMSQAAELERAGDSTGAAQRWAEAGESLSRALGVTQRLVNSDQEDMTFLSDLAASCVNLGKQVQEKDPSKSADYLQEARHHLDLLTRRRSDAEDLHSLALLHALEGRDDEAIAALKSARENGFANRPRIERNPSFRRISSRQDFQKLLPPQLTAAAEAAPSNDR